MKRISKKQEVSELEQKIAELTVGWQRCQADFTNFRRQVEEDRKNIVRLANADMMLDILPVLDNFQLAAKHVPSELENNNWTIGIKQIEKQLESLFGSKGLERIETVGNKFDHNFHEAIEYIKSDKPEGEIIEEISAGYKFDDTILRPAKVKVSAGNFHGERTK
jgi:molecular chaperone GrpE